MIGRRELLTAAGVVALAGCLDGGEEPTDNGADPSLESPAFDPGTTIPVEHTCDGEDVSPPLEIGDVSDDAGSLALLVDDPDAPTAEPFVHWLAWNLPPGTTEIAADVPPEGTVESLGGARQGTNDFGDVGYGGPCPPSGDGPHTYRFVLRILDRELDLEAGAERPALEAATDGAVIAEARTTATYER